MYKKEFQEDTLDKIDEIVNIVRSNNKKDYKQIKELYRDILDSLIILCIQERIRQRFMNNLMFELNQKSQDHFYIGGYKVEDLNETIVSIKKALSHDYQDTI
ncbi:MAG: hypothetical protein FWH29_10400 [Methanobrevibacter sp.]|nr:hypothetical protein [Methanobrevibacter sp.]